MSGPARAKVTSRGQVTLPKAIRDALGLDESSVVQFELTDGGALITPVAGGFISRFGTVPPRRHPENWHGVRSETIEKIGLHIAQVDR